MKLEISFEDICALTTIINKLEGEDAQQILVLICEASAAMGFAQGVLEMSKAMKGHT